MTTVHKRLPKRAFWIAVVLAIGVFIPVAGKSSLQWLDIHWLGESVKDTWGRLWYSEDWAATTPLPAMLSYAWLQASPRPILVAHAFGEAGLPGQNSMAALQRSLRAGLRLLEVDIWLDDAGRLRCHHGPLPPVEPVPEECTLLDAAHAAAAADAWLVLDIKTDFKATSDTIARQFKSDPTASRLIFQLYRPNDAQHFVALASVLPLPGPIVTAYRTRRSLDHVASQINRLGVKALTVPLYRSQALATDHRSGVALLVHPVHGCESLHQARSVKADGLYLTTDTVAQLRDQGCPEP
jgi:hypothetical protein